MQEPASDSEDLEQVYELNRLFLCFLRDQARHARSCLGLPRACLPRIAAAADTDIDAVAELPRALFVLELSDAATAEAWAPGHTAEARAMQSLQLTILLTLWHTSRRSAFRARSFFGLSSDTIRRLRGFTLSELPAFAAGSRLVACSFPDSAWFWSELLAAGDMTQRERLRLIALQPTLEGGAGRARESLHYA
jgi:hypothetical protein